MPSTAILCRVAYRSDLVDRPDSALRIMKMEAWIWMPMSILLFEIASVLTTGWPAGLVPNLSYPDVYSGDGLAAAWWIQRLLEGGAFHSDRSGYPFGSEVFDYPMSDAGSFVILKLIGVIARSYWATAMSRSTFATLRLAWFLPNWKIGCR